MHHSTDAERDAARQVNADRSRWLRASHFLETALGLVLSLVLAGVVPRGVVEGGLVKSGEDWVGRPFIDKFLLLAAVAFAALGVQSLLHVPRPHAHEQHGGRALAAIARQPVFVVAVLSAALGYGVMNLLMGATPLAPGTRRT